MDCDCVQQPDDAYQSKLAYWETQPVVMLLHRTSERVTVGASEPKRRGEITINNKAGIIVPKT